MATNVVSNDPYLSPGDRRPRSAVRTASSLESLLRPLASLKLTVVLFALAIFIVFAGTVAQVDQDVLAVVHHYFRSFFTWIDFRIFFPRTWNISGGFPFPGGWLIGSLLIVNLLAAHGLRFKIQAHGKRLLAGLAVIAAGIGVTWCVIHGVDTVDPAMLRIGVKFGLAALLGVTVYSLVTLDWSRRLELGLLSIATVVEGSLLGWLLYHGDFVPNNPALLWNGMKLGLAALLGVTVYSLITLDWSRRLELGLLSVATVVEGSLLGWLLYHSDFVPDNSSMRILWQLVQGGFAGLVLLAGCALTFKKRAGVVLIHAGVALMMLNELYVGMTAVEAQMRMTPGQVQNYVEDIRTFELAVVDQSGQLKNNVVVVPKEILLSGDVVRDDRLPFDVKVVKFIENAAIFQKQFAPTGAANLATDGLGKEWVTETKRAGTGTDTDAVVDSSTAYVSLLKKGTNQSLGTYLVTVALEDKPQPVMIDGKTFDLALRFKRTYEPYVVQLLKTEKENYEGTDKARSFSSDIHLIDPTNHTDRDHIHIWMNNPLRYNGETFYQSKFAQDPDSGESQTTLTVVANRGWMIPYIGCMIVAVGLLAHFLSVLTRFLRRRAEGSLDPREDAGPSAPLAELAGGSKSNRPGLSIVGEFFPWVAVAVLVGWAWSHAIPPRAAPEAMDLYKFGELPILYEGRVKPFDTVARNGLKAISDRQTWVDDEGHQHSAIEWLLGVITDSDDAPKQKIFRIENKEVLDLFGLKAREGSRYSVEEFRGGLKDFIKQVTQADAVAVADRSVFQRQILEFARRLTVYRDLQDSFRPFEFPPLPTAAELEKDPVAGQAAKVELRRMLQEDMPKFHAELIQRQLPFAVPPTSAGGEWEPYAMAVDVALIDQATHGPELNPATIALDEIFQAYRQPDTKAFNAAVTGYRDSLVAAPPKLLSANRLNKLDFEAFFNHFEPFYCGLVLYLIAFILACFALLGWSVPLNRAAFWLVATTLVLHTAAMIGRIYISGRPPVTNLYSAALFIGWAGVGLGLLLELIYRLGIGTLIAALAGFMTLLIAHFLASSGDTFTVMEAVLDTQFWLATHVVCITLGYATTFIAGLLGVFYVVQGVLTPSLSPIKAKSLVRMIYGVLCFAIFFSFVGTVLGGLWADDSWGRFWGWDPKENGALIIVIWNALVLHARWDGMVKDRGLAVLAIGGNIAVAWSGFGVNELGAGLHSYGFTQGVALWLSIFVASQLALIVLGSLPKRLWRSFRPIAPDAIA